MKRYRSVPRIQQQGCAAFRDPILGTDDNHISSAVNDGIEAIVLKVGERGCLALGNLASNSDANRVSMSKVQEWGCFALGNLALNSDANRVSIAAKHGIEAIVSAMAAYSNITEVQECGCLALANLACTNDAYRVSIAAKHGIEAILSAMTTHSNVSKVKNLGVQLLGISLGIAMQIAYRSLRNMALKPL
jgi:hypothetical protein